MFAPLENFLKSATNFFPKLTGHTYEYYLIKKFKRLYIFVKIKKNVFNPLRKFRGVDYNVLQFLLPPDFQANLFPRLQYHHVPIAIGHCLLLLF